MRAALTALAAAFCAVFAAPALALPVTDTLEDAVIFESDVCGPVTRTVALPRGARSVRVTSPEVGDMVDGEDATPAAAITNVAVTRRSGRARVQVTAEPDRAVCTDPVTGVVRGWSD